jgi:hypothetical protein
VAQKVTSKHSKDIDARLLAFVREKVDTFVKWDLVRFFHDNPHAANTAENIARFAARDPRTVEQELQELVTSGVIEASMAGNTRIYRYSKDQETRELIQAFVNACDDRDFRVRAINQVIKGLQ